MQDYITIDGRLVPVEIEFDDYRFYSDYLFGINIKNNTKIIYKYDLKTQIVVAKYPYYIETGVKFYTNSIVIDVSNVIHLYDTNMEYIDEIKSTLTGFKVWKEYVLYQKTGYSIHDYNLYCVPTRKLLLERKSIILRESSFESNIGNFVIASGVLYQFFPTYVEALFPLYSSYTHEFGDVFQGGDFVKLFDGSEIDLVHMKYLGFYFDYITRKMLT